MSPRLRVLAGTSLTSLVPITETVNTGTSHNLSSDAFEGQIIVNVKGFTNLDGEILDSEYFHREDRQGITWSIQVQGRFLNHYSADDVLFGNTFDRPLKLPWGSSAALKFMKYIDPTLEHDLTSETKPWALSPLISTMPHFVHKRLLSYSPHTAHSPLPPFSPTESISDDTTELRLALADPGSPLSSRSQSPASSASSSLSSLSSASKSSSKSKSSTDYEKIKRKEVTNKKKQYRLDHLSTSALRRSYFSSAKHRQQVQLGPHDMITTDFCYGFLEFSPTLSLRLPGGISFDLMRYWDGQPVRFVCCERKGSEGFASSGGHDSEPWGRIFWCVAIEMVEDDED